MKKQLLLTGLSLLLFTAVFAQKKNVTDAALRVGKFNLKGKYDAQQTLLIDAKNFIDLAAANEETKEDQNMHLNLIKIYSGLDFLEFKNKIIIDTTFKSCIEIKNIELVQNSFIVIEEFSKIPENKSKSKFQDVIIYVNELVSILFEDAVNNFNSKNFLKATQEFYLCNRYLNLIHNTGEDFNNSKVNYINSISSYFLMNRKDYSASDNFIKSINAVNCYPSIELILNTVEYGINAVNSIQTDIDEQKTKLKSANEQVDKEIADKKIKDLEVERNSITQLCIKSLDLGSEMDSLNKQIPYLQAFMSFNDYNFNSAKLYALKAYSLDNKYFEALDVLGLSCFNEGVLLYNELINIDWKSSKYKEVENASNEKFNEALKYYEISLEIQPNNKSALDNAYKACMKLGNIEKAKEYKTRLEALKG